MKVIMSTKFVESIIYSEFMKLLIDNQVTTPKYDDVEAAWFVELKCFGYDAEELIYADTTEKVIEEAVYQRKIDEFTLWDNLCIK